MTTELLTSDEAAARLHLSRKTLYAWSYRWGIEHVGPQPLKVGRRLMYRASDVEAYIASCEKAS